MLQKLKIVIVGEQDSGKTALANIVSGHMNDVNLIQVCIRYTCFVKKLLAKIKRNIFFK